MSVEPPGFSPARGADEKAGGGPGANTFFVDRRVVPSPPEPTHHYVMNGIAGFMRREDCRHDVVSSP